MFILYYKWSSHIESIWENMLRVYSNSAPFYVRDLSILGFWYLDSVLETMTQGSQGTAIVYFFFSYWNSLIFLFWSKYLAGNSSKMLNGNGESGILILFLILEESFKRSMTLFSVAVIVFLLGSKYLFKNLQSVIKGVWHRLWIFRK